MPKRPLPESIYVGKGPDGETLIAQIVLQDGVTEYVLKSKADEAVRQARIHSWNNAIKAALDECSNLIPGSKSLVDMQIRSAISSLMQEEVEP